MPFVTKDRRKIIYEEGLDGLHDYPERGMGPQVGDICYSYYKPMVDKWKANPRWTTAHEIYKNLHMMPVGKMTDDEWAAKDLAWQVFFQLYVMPYELKKREENGDI